LIQLLGYPVTVTSANVNEDSVTHPDPAVNVVQTADLKAMTIAAQTPPQTERTIILTADTTVALDGQMLNKPADAAEAIDMLNDLRDRTHEVHTGVVLLDAASGEKVTGVHTAVVTMRPYTDAEIAAYVATGDPLDKAGAYAIQHPIFRPVARLDGCYLGVMGLSLCHLLHLLRPWEVAMLADLTAVHQAHQHYPCPLYQDLLPNSG
jgi:septum formation protein